MNIARRAVVLAMLVAAVLAPFPAHGRVCGDVDGDGAADVVDAANVLRAAAGLPSACTPAACDLDGDGMLTAGDALLALHQAVGLPITACGTGSVAGTLSVPETAVAGVLVREHEPNDSAGTAEPVGPLAGGDSYQLAGAITDGNDAFDGYRFVASEDLTLDLLLRFTAAPGIDLDLLVDDPAGGAGTVGCEGTARGLESCTVEVGSAGRPRAFDVVVVPAAGSLPASYTLAVTARSGGARTSGLMPGTGAERPIDIAVDAYRGVEADFVPGEVVAAMAARADAGRVDTGRTGAGHADAGHGAGAERTAAAGRSAARGSATPSMAAVADLVDRAGMSGEVEPVAVDPAGVVLLRLGTDDGVASAETAEPGRTSDPAAATPQDPAAAKRERGSARVWTRAAIARLARSPEVAYAHPNYIAHPARAPNDPLFAAQWHYGLIGLPDAWDVTVGRDSVIVAVIDTGIRPEHPDLQGRLVAGFDFITSATRAGDGDGIDPDPFDPGDLPASPLAGSFHGTHVAGTIGATTDNGRGVAGITWRTRLMPVRALGIGGGTVFDIAQAIAFAAGLPNVSGTVPPEPARVLNLSLAVFGDMPVLRSAVDRATGAGALVVAAAGNGASDAFVSPAGFENSLSVAAVDLLGDPAPYSNFGPRVDLAAPGGNARVDLNGDGLPDEILSTLLAGGREYVRYQGTSMACAHVSGVAALALAVDAGLSPAALRHVLETSAQDRGPPGRDDRYGFGLVDAARALRAVAGGPAPVVPRLALDTLVLGFDADHTILAVRAVNTGGGALTVGATTAVTDDGGRWLAARFDAATTSVAVTVDRDGLMVGTYGGRVAVESNGGNQDIRVLMKVAPQRADVGTVFVRLVDPETRATRAEVATGAGAGYRYRVDGVAPGRYQIFAGTDHDRDRSICDVGELCGAFPLLDQPEVVTVIGGRALEHQDFALSLITGQPSPGSRVPRNGTDLEDPGP